MLLGWSHYRHSLLGSLWLLATVASTTVVGAAEPIVNRVAKARATGGQPELAVGFDPQGRLRARITNGATLDLEQGTILSVPDSLLMNRDKVALQIVPIGEQRHAIVVSLPTELKTRQWQALIVAKPGKNEPEVLFQGFTGYVEGEDGLRKGPVLEVSAAIDDTGTRRIVLGETREDLTLCGRAATLSPKMLSPKDLTFKPAKLQRLSAEERERAVKLTAAPHAEAASSAVTAPASSAVTAPASSAVTAPASSAVTAPASSAVTAPASSAVTAPASTNSITTNGSIASSASSNPNSATTDSTRAASHEQPRPDNVTPQTAKASLLRALGASSAVGWPASLTDGDPETTWAENRGGAGRGEFVTFRAPSDVPIQGFDFVIKPGKREIPKGVGASSLWLVTSNQVFAVNFPSDPWKAPLVRWHVDLPAPVQTDCVALVTESAYSEKPDSEVTFAELTAQSEFATANIDQLVGALAGGGPRADSASTVLSAMGPEAYRAVAKAFLSFDEGGKRVALDVLDHAPCSESNAVYIQALLGNVEAHRLHAIDRLRRCGAEATTFIEQALGSSPSLKQRPLLELFAEIAPERAITYVAPRLNGSVKTRKLLREIIAQASRSPKASPSLREQLARTDLPSKTFVDLLRAVGPKLTNYGEVVSVRLEQLLATEPDWKTRYLLLAPAHLLAKTNTTIAQRLSTLMRQDPSPFVRLEAVRSVEQYEHFAPDLLAAVADSEMRVRQAATQVLANYRHPSTDAAIRTRLKEDSWPEVRAQAAESLAAHSSSIETDRALIEALGDDAWLVRVAVADALGSRQSLASGEALLERLDDSKERVEVRVAAANSLGQICYEPAIDTLTDQVKKLKSAGMDLRDRAISASALSALGQIHPTDLAKRLEPLLSGKDVPKEIRQAAQAAMTNETPCRQKNAIVTAKAQTK
jgi:HEAT repeat protein